MIKSDTVINFIAINILHMHVCEVVTIKVLYNVIKVQIRKLKI